MYFKKIFEQMKDILLHPDECWERIIEKEETVKDLLINYTIIVAAIPAICSFIGLAIVGIPVAEKRFRMPVTTSLLMSGFYYIAWLLIAFIIGVIIDLSAPKFHCLRDIEESLQIAVYANTASWLSGIILIIPTLSNFSLLFSIYTLFLLYKGIEKIKCPEEQDLFPYVSVAIVAYIIETIIILVLNHHFIRQIIKSSKIL